MPAAGRDHVRASRWRAVVGLLLIGTGASTVGYTASLHANHAGLWDLIAWGTLGLIIINAGVCFFGDAVKHATLATLADNQADR